jgi:hypothetical protein
MNQMKHPFESAREGRAVDEANFSAPPSRFSRDTISR